MKHRRPGKLMRYYSWLLIPRPAIRNLLYGEAVPWDVLALPTPVDALREIMELCEMTTREVSPGVYEHNYKMREGAS